MRIVYLATADARGHLMRAQLLAHALRAHGVDVQVLTTSDDGARFLAGFRIDAPVLSRHYAVQFDARQNMQREATDRNVAHYVFHPGRMLRDITVLRRWMRDADLIVDDSFHPALLCMGCMPGWRRKVVHVYGGSLRRALETNFSGRAPLGLAPLFRRLIAWQIDAARARLEHDFAFAAPIQTGPNDWQLPTPVAVADSTWDAAPSCAAVYLNPHFRDAAMADALERGLAAAGMPGNFVGEGHAGRAGWRTQDPDWVNTAAHSSVIVSAPGMAALSVAAVYRKPILLLLTDQPEQAINAGRAKDFGLVHRIVVWRGDGPAFACELEAAVRELLAAAPTPAADARDAARSRLDPWRDLLIGLAGPR